MVSYCKSIVAIFPDINKITNIILNTILFTYIRNLIVVFCYILQYNFAWINCNILIKFQI